MSDDRLAAALSRIENALSRVEDAAARPIAAPPPSDNSALVALESRHSVLKEEARAAIVELDRLIAQARTGGIG